MLLTVSAPTVLSCSECLDGHYVVTGTDYAACACGHEVTPSLDIARHLEWDERMVTVTLAGATVLAYFTEETCEEGEGLPMRATLTQHGPESWLRVVSNTVLDLPRVRASLTDAQRATLSGQPLYTPSEPTPAELAEGYRYADWWTYGTEH